MKEVTKERKSLYTVFEAVDGTEFYTKEECSIYEDSAKGVIRSKIAKMIEGKGNAWETLGGYDDHLVVAIKMNRPEDLDTVKQFFLLESPYYNRKDN
jgi:acetylglutamate kinase